LAKIDYARDGSTDDFWLKDGLVFAHTEQEYDEGLNPLTLQWKDKMTTMYPYEKSHDGYVGVVLHVNEEQEFTCQEDQPLETHPQSEDAWKMGELVPNRNY